MMDHDRSDATGQRETVERLFTRHDRSFPGELGLDLAKGTPSVLLRWLCVSLLLSAPIFSRIALDAARALAATGWTTTARMAAGAWEDRVRVLSRAGYARFDVRMSRMRGDTAGIIMQEYGGDLRRRREAAGRHPAAERQRLNAFKGIGDVGADIFFREMQLTWDEHFPFADSKALGMAARLGLPQSAAGLADLAGKEQIVAPEKLSSPTTR